MKCFHKYQLADIYNISVGNVYNIYYFHSVYEGSETEELGMCI